MPKATCTIDGCDRAANYQQLCTAHHAQQRTPEQRARVERTATMRFWTKVRKTAECWEWTGAIGGGGYGRFMRPEGAVIMAHRYSFELHGGMLEEELDIDHICGNRLCVNPAHLRKVTRKQNLENMTVLRSDNKSGYRGVSKRRGRWTARVSHNKKVYVCGDFDTAEEAAEAVRLKRIELYTHNDRDRIA